MNDIRLNRDKELWNSPAGNIDDIAVERAYSHLKEFTSKTRRASGRRVCAAAAIILACIVAGMLLGTTTHALPGFWEEPTYTEAVALAGTTRSLVLEDGTQVLLNSQSRLVYTDNHSGHSRNVFLCGEGYFDVAEDPQRPFLVHAAGNVIKVTGTRFNVRAFLDEDSSTISVMDGSVEVSVIDQQNSTRLNAGSVLTINSADKSIKMSSLDAGNDAGWLRGEFYARYLTLGEICRELERKFGVRINITNDTAASKVFLASFVNDEDIDEIFEAINMKRDFKIRKKGNVYTIH